MTVIETDNQRLRERLSETRHKALTSSERATQQLMTTSQLVTAAVGKSDNKLETGKRTIPGSDAEQFQVMTRTTLIAMGHDHILSVGGQGDISPNFSKWRGRPVFCTPDFFGDRHFVY